MNFLEIPEILSIVFDFCPIVCKLSVFRTNKVIARHISDFIPTQLLLSQKENSKGKTISDLEKEYWNSNMDDHLMFSNFKLHILPYGHWETFFSKLVPHTVETTSQEEWVSFQNRNLEFKPDTEFHILSKFLLDNLTKKEWNLGSHCSFPVSPFLLNMEKHHQVLPMVQYDQPRWFKTLEASVAERKETCKEFVAELKLSLIHQKTAASERALAKMEELDAKEFVKWWLEISRSENEDYCCKEKICNKYSDIIKETIPKEDLVNYKFVLPNPLSFEILYQDDCAFEDDISVLTAMNTSKTVYHDDSQRYHHFVPNFIDDLFLNNFDGVDYCRVTVDSINYLKKWQCKDSYERNSALESKILQDFLDFPLHDYVDHMGPYTHISGPYNEMIGALELFCNNFDDVYIAHGYMAGPYSGMWWFTARIGKWWFGYQVMAERGS